MNEKIMSKIRDHVKDGIYDVTHHANGEMADDNLHILDIESALLTGQIVRVEKGEPRGAKYTVIGTATDQLTRVGVVGRFTDAGPFLIITVYEVND